MADPYKGFSRIDTQGESWSAVVPSDSVDLLIVPKGVWVDGAGNIAMQGSDGVAATFAVPASSFLSLRPQRILATGTTCTGIKAIF